MRQQGCPSHNSHLKMEKGQVQVPIQVAEDKEVETIKQALGRHLPNGAIRSLVEERTGLRLTAKQISNLRRATKAENEVLSADGSKRTPADQLLESLYEDDTVSCRVLFAERDSTLLTINKMRLKGVSNSGSETAEIGDEMDLEAAADPSGKDESAEMIEDRIRSALGITGSSKILLSVAWTTKTSQRAVPNVSRGHLR